MVISDGGGLKRGRITGRPLYNKKSLKIPKG